MAGGEFGLESGVLPQSAQEKAKEKYLVLCSCQSHISMKKQIALILIFDQDIHRRLLI